MAEAIVKSGGKRKMSLKAGNNTKKTKPLPELHLTDEDLQGRYQANFSCYFSSKNSAHRIRSR